jgi:hypothetical protein
MATDWKVEGNGPKTKIKASCPVCHSEATMHGDPGKVIHEKFKHGGCEALVEPIPMDIRDEYWQRAVISRC